MAQDSEGSFGDRERPETESSAGAAESGGQNSDPAQELLRLSRERDEYLSLWQRAQADYQNQRRRAAAENEAQVRSALEPLLEDLLLVADHLDMALASPAQSAEAKNLAMGVELVRHQLHGLLDRAGVSPVPAEGSFDASRHQAVQSEPRSDVAPGTCVATVRKGYLWRGRVLRFAQVKVSTAPAAATERDPVVPSAAEPAPQGPGSGA
jgi:molecular chaperone GrpE